MSMKQTFECIKSLKAAVHVNNMEKILYQYLLFLVMKSPDKDNPRFLI